MSYLKQIFQNKKFLIYGIGKTGISSFNFLKKNNKVFLYDENKNIFKNKKFNNFFLEKKKIYQNNFDYIVISPGIDTKNCDLKQYLKKNSKKIITDLDIFYIHNQKNKIITITGTNGKSTTAKLLNIIIKKHNFDSRLCGNIGNPILSEKKISKKTIFVIEASSYQIAYSKMFKSNYALILNISPDHLERHGSMNNYVNAKFKLFKNQTKNDFAFINLRDNFLKNKIKKYKIFSKTVHVDNNLVNSYKKKITNNYFLTKSNLENLSFILALCKKLNLQNRKIIKIVNKFRGLKYRQQIIYKNKNITFINDSKATSFSSSINILRSLKKVFWLVGGIGKLGDKFTLQKHECKNIIVYIFGKNKNFFIKQFKNRLMYICFKNLESALKQILKDIKKDYNNLHKTVLFSPSAASFDSFKNFEERGDYFNFLLKKHKVKQIINAIK
tara:strand:+ start:362 stop:1687 length:1326 start_codon:yes stop_codon:yes gene_type:complete